MWRQLIDLLPARIFALSSGFVMFKSPLAFRPNDVGNAKPLSKHLGIFGAGRSTENCKTPLSRLDDQSPLS
jgi:hypothetical protein